MTLILCCWFQWLSKLFTEIRYFIGWFSWVNKCKMFTFGLDKQTNRISKWDIYLGALFRRLEKKKKTFANCSSYFQCLSWHCHWCTWKKSLLNIVILVFHSLSHWILPWHYKMQRLFSVFNQWWNSEFTNLKMKLARLLVKKVMFELDFSLLTVLAAKYLIEPLNIYPWNEWKTCIIVRKHN